MYDNLENIRMIDLAMMSKSHCTKNVNYQEMIDST